MAGDPAQQARVFVVHGAADQSVAPGASFGSCELICGAPGLGKGSIQMDEKGMLEAEGLRHLRFEETVERGSYELFYEFAEKNHP